MLRWHKRSAVMTLLTMLLPWPATTALALHAADDHVPPYPDVAAVLHGHEHAAGTPAHDHTLTTSPNTTPVPSRVVLASVLRNETLSVNGSRLPPPPIGWPAPPGTASPPAGLRAPESVLRI